MTKFLVVFAREILESRRNPIVEVDVYFSTRKIKCLYIQSSVYSRKNEALQNKYKGKVIIIDVYDVNNKIAHQIIGMDVMDKVCTDIKYDSLQLAG